jgi:hypothetical protein
MPDGPKSASATTTMLLQYGISFSRVQKAARKIFGFLISVADPRGEKICCLTGTFSLVINFHKYCKLFNFLKSTEKICIN